MDDTLRASLRMLYDLTTWPWATSARTSSHRHSAQRNFKVLSVYRWGSDTDRANPICCSLPTSSAARASICACSTGEAVLERS